ncbi:MAG: ATP synthase F1 subunit delta [Acidobacteria bacterium]|nr:MAG: ATP synthase F1 subunit delta [Acidobacteriota bacterium]
MFRFGRIVEGNPQLQAALADRRADAQARATLVDRLLSVKAAPESVRLARQAVSGTRGRRFDHALEAFLEQAAAHQEQVTATVTTAVPLSQEQQDRLTRALSTQYGRQVHTHVVIDEDVVGGIRVEIGDEVIDGTVSHRLAEARRLLTS